MAYQTNQNATNHPWTDLTGHIERITEFAVDQGGTADIYKGRWRNPKNGTEMLALKILRGVTIEQVAANVQRRIPRECRAWSRMNHVNVLRFMGVCEGICGRTAFIFPWMTNGNLNEYMKGHPQASRRRLILDIITGLGYMHSKRVVHGDIKACNVLVDGEGRAVLSDFGTSFVLGVDEASKNLCAAAHWTAPEIVNNENENSIPLTFHSDMWSLGITMLEIYVGKERLWGGVKLPTVVIKKMMSRRTPAVGGRNAYPEVPPHLWDILDECWKYEPDERCTVEDALANYKIAIGLDA